MPLITLISDWKNNDYYTGAVKGKLYQLCPQANIIDISHSIVNYNSSQAAFVLKNCYNNFPDNTIHLILINCETTEEQPFVIVKNFNQYFIGVDNGMFGLIFKNKPEAIFKINKVKKNTSFIELNLLAEVAGKLASGSQPEDFGKIKEDINRNIPLRPTIDPDVIMGSVIYIDSYQNAISNISQELFEKERKGRKFSIYVDSNHYEINAINTAYNETPLSDLFALFNSSGLLEIAINKGEAATLLNLKINSKIRIKFYDNKNR